MATDTICTDSVFECNLKNDRLISLCLQSKSFKITVIQVYALTSNAEEAEEGEVAKEAEVEPVTLKKLKLNGSMKTYKSF